MEFELLGGGQKPVAFAAVLRNPDPVCGWRDLVADVGQFPADQPLRVSDVVANLGVVLNGLLEDLLGVLEPRAALKIVTRRTSLPGYLVTQLVRLLRAW
jgi:hypothetical protein